MGLRDEDFAWVPRQRLAALLAVADTARRIHESEVLGEEDLDRLSDALFTLDRGGEGWRGSASA